MQNEKAIVNTFNNYFTDVTHSLGLKKKNIGLEISLSKIVNNSRNFEGIKKIKESQEAAETQEAAVSKEEVKNAIKTLSINKSTISDDIPTKLFKQHAQIDSKNLADIFN